jgi:hypothetical protein
MTIIFNLLKRAVLVYLKVILAEPRNRSAFVVLYGGVQDHAINTHTDFVGVNPVKLGRLDFLRACNTGQSQQENKRDKASARGGACPHGVYSRAE